MTKKLPLELKQTRKPIHTACGFCHEKHLQCDVGRPCQNCKKRNIAYSCRDKVRKKRKGHDAGDDFEKEEVAIQPLNFDTVNSGGIRESSAIVQDNKETETTTSGGKDSGSEFQVNKNTEDFSRAMEQAADTIIASSLLDEPIICNTDNTGWGFGSMWTNDEYMKLNDITSLVPEIIPNELDATTEEYPLQKTTEESLQESSDSSHASQYLNYGSKLHRSYSRPYISLDMTQTTGAPSAAGSIINKEPNKGDVLSQQKESEQIQLGRRRESLQQDFCEQPNDSDVGLTPFKLRMLIKTPSDLFDKRELIKPHNYREAYKDLLQCLHNMFLGSYYRQQNNGCEPVSRDEAQVRKMTVRREQLQHIAKSIREIYIPKFVALTSNMIEEDLLLQEFVLQRSLLELGNMSKLVNCTPICIWRRSGEICFVSNEFCSLTGFHKRQVLDQRRFIVEFMDHQSVVNYYDLFHNHLAFGPKETKRREFNDDQAVYTDSNLLLSSGSYLKCACCLTAKRDAFNISLLLMGQFLPIFDVQ